MPDPTLLFALRHGQTAWNAEARVQGQLDIPLDTVGRDQAARLGQALAGAGIAAIYSSDLLRARATADAVAAASGAAVVDEPALRERGFGEFEGLSFVEVDTLYPLDSARWRRREPGYAPPGGGETLEDFYARCIGAAATLAERHRGQTIALVAHGGVLDCLYRAATNVDLQANRSWQLGNATINRLLWHGEGFTLVGWNDRAHLEEPALS